MNTTTINQDSAEMMDSLQKLKDFMTPRISVTIISPTGIEECHFTEQELAQMSTKKTIIYDDEYTIASSTDTIEELEYELRQMSMTYNVKNYDPRPRFFCREKTFTVHTMHDTSLHMLNLYAEELLEHYSVALVVGEVDGKVRMILRATEEAVRQYGIHCGEIMAVAAKALNGNGGGSLEKAMAGGSDITYLEAAVEVVKEKIQALQQ